MNVLVTGASGFIGSHVVRKLLGRGHAVHAFVRPGTRAGALVDLNDRISISTVDLDDEGGVRAALRRAGPDATVHLAWYAEPATYLRDERRNLASLEATARLLRLLLDSPCRRLVLAGTCLEDASPDAFADRPIYATAKRAAHDVAAGVSGPELRVACAHVFSVFGPGEDERRAVPSVALRLLRGQAVEVTAGTQLRDYVHVLDAAAAMATILESDVEGGVDVCTGSPRPLRAVFEELGRATGRSDLIRWGARPAGADDTFDAVGDPTTLRALGWRPGAPFARRVDETVAWWRAHRPLTGAGADAGRRARALP